MKIIDPGHVFELASLDGEQSNILIFVKREGDKYPGNIGHHPGTTIQDVLRAAASRLEYVCDQEPCEETRQARFAVIDAIRFLEQRAARKHTRELEHEDANAILYGSVCSNCGHLECELRCL